MSEYLYGALLGIVQGITEFLPVSSSAHLIIVSKLFNGDTLPLSLNVALHFGTLMAVLCFFYKDWSNILHACYRRAIYKEKSFLSDTMFVGIIIGSIPAATIGLLFKDQIESYFHHPRSTIVPLALVGVLMWWVDKKMSKEKALDQLSIPHCLYIGFAQTLALIPGVSRSGSTITCARLLGYDRQESARFSFLLGTPAMGGAALLHFNDLTASLSDPVFYAGITSSFIVGMISIKVLLDLLKKFGLFGFAVYRVFLAVLLFYIVF